MRVRYEGVYRYLENCHWYLAKEASSIIAALSTFTTNKALNIMLFGGQRHFYIYTITLL
jgi:hypothetical protein